MGIALPTETLTGHLQFHKIMVIFVAGAIIAAGEHPRVNDTLSSISFNNDRLKSDERFPVIV